MRNDKKKKVNPYYVSNVNDERKTSAPFEVFHFAKSMKKKRQIVMPKVEILT